MRPLPQPPTGSIFGRLTVLGPAPRSARKQSQTLVRCVCGTERAVVTSWMLSGKQWACGCARRRGSSAEVNAAFAPGVRFGMLTVVRSEGEGSSREVHCVCDCGQRYSTPYPGALRGGRVRSCGCLVADKARERAQKLRAHALGGHVQHAGGR